MSTELLSQHLQSLTASSSGLASAKGVKQKKNNKSHIGEKHVVGYEF
jgi:hypothetical protein